MRLRKKKFVSKKTKESPVPEISTVEETPDTDSTVSEAAIEEKKKDGQVKPSRSKKKKYRRKSSRPVFRLKPIHIFLIFILLLFVLGGVYLSQQTTLSSIAEEKAELQNELDSLKVEQERLERMLEYMSSDEYLMQYAREKLGFVFQDDIKFYTPNQP